MDKQVVIGAITKFTRKKPADVQDHLSLSSLGVSASFGLSMVRGMIEAESGRKLPVFTVNTTVGQLVQLANGGGATAAAPRPNVAATLAATLAPVEIAVSPNPYPPARATPAAMQASFGLGLDMQEIDVLPQVTDLRGDPFYAANFTPSELATAALRPDARAHLCGTFCAKEAMKKSHPMLIDLRMDEVFVIHDTAGRPRLQLLDEALRRRFSFVVSITHTGKFAAATCLTVDSTP